MNCELRVLLFCFDFENVVTGISRFANHANMIQTSKTFKFSKKKSLKIESQFLKENEYFDHIRAHHLTTNVYEAIIEIRKNGLG